MLPSINNFFALLCIAVVLAALLLWLLRACAVSPRLALWLTFGGLGALWLPAGAAHIPVVAYVRGISSDLSITLVALACLVLFRDVFPPVGEREKIPVFAAVLVAAVFLYPMALGLGDWDPYRLGWGQAVMWTGLLALVVACWLNGLRLLPALIALALLAWTVGLLESGNLWDYLLDPWLVLAACVQLISLAPGGLARHLRRRRAQAFNATTALNCNLSFLECVQAMGRFDNWRSFFEIVCFCFSRPGLPGGGHAGRMG